MAHNDLSTFTVGMSKVGLSSYLDEIKAIVLSEGVTALENTGDVEAALREGWQGESCDMFIENFKKKVNSICDQLQKEYTDLQNRLQQIENYYLAQDKELVQSIE